MSTETGCEVTGKKSRNTVRGRGLEAAAGTRRRWCGIVISCSGGIRRKRVSTICGFLTFDSSSNSPASAAAKEAAVAAGTAGGVVYGHVSTCLHRRATRCSHSSEGAEGCRGRWAVRRHPRFEWHRRHDASVILWRLWGQGKEEARDGGEREREREGVVALMPSTTDCSPTTQPSSHIVALTPFNHR